MNSDLTASPARSRRRALGFASSPRLAPADTWSRWLAQIKVFAENQDLQLVRNITDRPRGGAARPVDNVGLAGLVELLRVGMNQRDERVEVVVVPTLEHLSPGRDGSEGSVQLLLRLHFGVDVLPVLVGRGRPDARRGPGVSPFVAVLLGHDETRLPGGRP